MGNKETSFIREQQQAIDKERIRIARDLHDGTLQTITHISHKLEFVQRLLERHAGDRAIDELQKVRTILATCLHTLRHDISSLMQTSLDRQDIAPALLNLLENFKASERAIALTSTIDALDFLPPVLAEPLFRFVQETLNNVRKHAQATEVRVSIRLSSTQLTAGVFDNGVGMLPQSDTTNSHLGLRILRERVQEVGGIVTIESSRGKGTCIKAVFPISTQ